MNNFLVFFFSAGLCLLPLQADTWPHFRGSDQSGVITGMEIPTHWSADENIVWKVPSPGKGWSSPVVWGDRIFFTTSELKGSAGDLKTMGPQYDRLTRDNEFILSTVCMDKNNGQILWKRVCWDGHPNITTHSGSPYAAETPATDGERVYAHFGTMGLYAFDFDGNRVWKNDFGIYEMDGDWGTGTSPILHDGMLIMQIDNVNFSSLIALEAKTGKEIWRVNREEGPNRSTPYIWRNRLRTELVTQGAITRSYDPKSGDLLWQFHMQGGRNSSTPVGDQDRLILANEKRSAGGNMYSIKAGASGDISLAEGETSNHGVEWANPNGGIAMSSPLLYKDKVYAFERRTGMVSCYDALTGDVHYYRKHVPKAREFWSSPWAYEDEVYCIDGKGITHVLDSGTAFREVRQNVIDDTIWTIPAFTPGSAIIRGAEYIYSIKAGQPEQVAIE